jgi:hypothetical protein
LNELDLKTLQSAQKTRKLESALRFDSSRNTNDDIDFFLLKACLDEYENIGDQTDGLNDDVSKIFALICKRFNYDLDKITYIFDMEEDGYITNREFETVCKDIIPNKSSRNN